MGRKKRITGVDDTFGIDGRSDPFPGIDRVTLLEKIGELGSIMKAAKAAGVSYKTAWETVDAVNNLSGAPLVERTAGGRSGGGTLLTEKGREVVRTYRVIREEHRKFLASIRERIGVVDNLGLKEGMDAYAIIKASSVIVGKAVRAGQLSARNVLSGKIATLTEGPVSAEVTIVIGNANTLAAVITEESLRNLELKVGEEACAIFKASSVILGIDG